MSIASLFALMLYACVIAACLAAGRATFTAPARNGDRLHWFAASAVFIGLAAARLVGAEDRIRVALRSAITEAGEYGERAIWQAPLAIAALIAGFVAFILLARGWSRIIPGSRMRYVMIARAGLLVLAGLTVLRLVSFHQTDQLLYSGPIRLNWLGEGVACLLVGVPAALYARMSARRSRAMRQPQ